MVIKVGFALEINFIFNPNTFGTTLYHIPYSLVSSD